MQVTSLPPERRQIIALRIFEGIYPGKEPVNPMYSLQRILIVKLELIEVKTSDIPDCVILALALEIDRFVQSGVIDEEEAMSFLLGLISEIMEMVPASRAANARNA